MTINQNEPTARAATIIHVLSVERIWRSQLSFRFNLSICRVKGRKPIETQGEPNWMHIMHLYTSLTLNVDHLFLLLRQFKGVNCRLMWCTHARLMTFLSRWHGDVKEV